MDVKDWLKGNHLTQLWLLDRLAERGIRLDKTGLSTYLSGRRDGTPKAEEVHATILDVITEYEHRVS